MKPLDAFNALTPDALAALERSGVSRRNFLKQSGVLVVGFSTGFLTSRLSAPGSAAAQRLDGAGRPPDIDPLGMEGAAQAEREAPVAGGEITRAAPDRLRHRPAFRADLNARPQGVPAARSSAVP